MEKYILNGVEFKVGDSVRCKENPHFKHELYLNKVYFIEQIEKYLGDIIIKIKGIDDHKRYHLWRFELHDEPEEQNYEEWFEV